MTSFYGFNQSSSITDLEIELSKAKTDSARVWILSEISLFYRSNDIDKSEEFANQAFEIATESGNRILLAKTIISFVRIDTRKGKLDTALYKGLRLLEVLNADTLNFDKNSDLVNLLLSKAYEGIAGVYFSKGNFSQAIRFNIKSRETAIAAKFDRGIAVAYSNLGSAYNKSNDYENAVLNYNKAIEMLYQFEDTLSAIQIELNLMLINYYDGDYEKSKALLRKGVTCMRNNNHLLAEGLCYTHLSRICTILNQADSSIFYIQKAIEIHLRFEDKEVLFLDYLSLAKTLEKQQKVQTAEKYLQKALQLSIAIESKPQIAEVYANYSDLYKNSENYSKALEYYELSRIYTDSVNTENNSKAIGKIEAESEFNKEIAIQRKENEQVLKIADEKQKQQSLIIYFSIGIILVILFFVYMVLKSLRQTREQKELVQLGKDEIEIKNRELTDSIKYAKRIQFALLKETKQTSSGIPEHFILFEPKDIISGDFYWTFSNKNYWYIAAADCTGHGVPGAMLTMLGTAYLNEICSIGNELSPAEILDALKDKITTELSQTGLQGETKDGMDISIIRIDLKTNEAIWAGANNPLYHIKNNVLTEIKGDKQPVGYSDNVFPFTNHQIQLEKGNSIYLFSDGYADQFGGPKGKKLKYSNFKKLLQQKNNESPQNQKASLKKIFHDWKGDLEQLDDVCVIGLKF